VVTLVLKPNICQDFLVSDMVYFWRGDDSAAAVETIRKLAAGYTRTNADSEPRLFQIRFLSAFIRGSSCSMFSL